MHDVFSACLLIQGIRIEILLDIKKLGFSWFELIKN